MGIFRDWLKRKLMPHADAASAEQPLFSRLVGLVPFMPAGTPAFEPSKLTSADRVRMLEAKVEYLLDELYRLKSLHRLLGPKQGVPKELQEYQLSTFDFQWKALPYHDEFLTNPEWRTKAAEDVSRRLGVPQEWFKGKKILDAGCGPGRHTWAFASLGAHVTAFDMSDNGLEAARRDCAHFPNVTFEKRNVLDPLPYDRDFDLVWSYGVVHVTNDPHGALRNIAQHVKPGGFLYFMVYAEPRRDNQCDYTYYHEISAIREATRRLSFDDKAKILERLEGAGKAQIWFDAISSEINELFTVEELTTMLKRLGFVDIKRTMPEETMHNMVGRKPL